MQKTSQRIKLPKSDAKALEILTREAQRPGLLILEFAHDDRCPAIRTQRDDDCVCSPDRSLVRVSNGGTR